ncbi:MAG: NAD(P)/FAD-dependent oxidoreductase, partial [Nocardiopsaceae bacterium]|nr:NAD(P)/FAD-dependent oxidoreductase [Nocardiopsaceae bacterium]
MWRRPPLPPSLLLPVPPLPSLPSLSALLLPLLPPPLARARWVWQPPRSWVVVVAVTLFGGGVVGAATLFRIPEGGGAMSPRRVVLIGHGMVGHRFCEEIRRRDPDGSRVALTVLAAEPRPAYNRILLPNLLSGVMREEELSLGATGGVIVRTGTSAVALDLPGRTVLSSAGEAIGYDHLVLATGAVARIPKIPGIDRSVLALRTVGDARRLTTIAADARRKHGRVIVLGGGVLGLEAARALAARGTAVTVVHPVDRLMERQVDSGGGRVLAAAMRRTGVDIEVGVGASWWEPGQGLWTMPSGARRATGVPATEIRGEARLIRATGMLVSTGAAPDAGLARDAGLRLTEFGAVAVDDTLTTSDPAVHAIGDCAGHPGAPGGLVQPGWEQAEVLAARLATVSLSTGDSGSRYRGSTILTRLKAAGIELTCVGDGLREEAPGADPAPEILRFEDPARERYAKLVIEGDRIAGAIMIGLPDAAASITQLYDRGAPAPADRLALLLGRALPPEVG